MSGMNQSRRSIVVSSASRRILRKEDLCISVPSSSDRLTLECDASHDLASNPKFTAVGTKTGNIFVSCGDNHVGKAVQSGTLRFHRNEISALGWNPFNDNVLASASSDGLVCIWHVMDDIKACTIRTRKRSSKVYCICWHPTVDNLLLVGTSSDIFLWNLEADSVLWQIKSECVHSLSFSDDGLLFCTVSSRASSLHVFDSRTGKVLSSRKLSHNGNIVRQPEALMLNYEFLILCGLNSLPDIHQLVLVRSSDIATPVAALDLDSSASSKGWFVFFDADLSVLYVAEEDSTALQIFNIYLGSSPNLEPLGSINGLQPFNTMVANSKRALNLAKLEIMKFQSLDEEKKQITSSSVVVHDSKGDRDLYPPTRGSTPSASLAEWLAGLDASPVLLQLKPGLPAQTNKPVLLKGVMGSPQLMTADINNDRKFRFLSQVTKPDYRAKEERDDWDKIRKEEEVREKIQSNRESVSDSSAASLLSSVATTSSLSDDVTTASEIPKDPISTKDNHSKNETEEDSVLPRLVDEDDCTTYTSELSTDVFPEIDPLSGLSEGETATANDYTGAMTGSMATSAGISELDHDEISESRTISECPETNENTVNDYSMPTTSTITKTLDEAIQSTGELADDELCPATIGVTISTESNGVRLGLVGLNPPSSLTNGDSVPLEVPLSVVTNLEMLPPCKVEKMRITSSPLSINSEELNMSVSPSMLPNDVIMSPATTVHSSLLSGTLESARSLDSAASTRRRPVDEPIDVETNPFRQYFHPEENGIQMSPPIVPTDESSSIAPMAEIEDKEMEATQNVPELIQGLHQNGVIDHGNAQMIMYSSQESLGSYRVEGQRLLENTVSMLERQLKHSDDKIAQLEKTCDNQQRDMDSLRYEIKWKDERIDYLQKALADMEQGRKDSL